MLSFRGGREGLEYDYNKNHISTRGNHVSRHKTATHHDSQNSPQVARFNEHKQVLGGAGLGEEKDGCEAVWRGSKQPQQNSIIATFLDP